MPSALFTVLVLALLTSCTTSPARDAASVPATRYWKASSSILRQSAMTVTEDQLAVREVPFRSNPKLVIIMYHNLVYGRTGSEYNRDIYNFEHDMAFIKSRFRIIDFSELVAIRNGTMKLESDAAIITFDDGDLSMYAIAYPLLREYGIKATFFIISGFVGEVGYMNWSQIRELAGYRDAAGNALFTMGSHGTNHLYLEKLDAAAIAASLADSRAAIERETGQKVEVLALPFGSGSGSKVIADLALKAGYTAIRTSEEHILPVKAVDLLRLPCINITNASTDREMKKIWTMLGR